MEYSEEAIRLDRGYAVACHGGSLVHILDTLMGVVRPADAFAKAQKLLDEDLAIQTDSAMLQKHAFHPQNVPMEMAGIRAGNRARTRRIRTRRGCTRSSGLRRSLARSSYRTGT